MSDLVELLKGSLVREMEELLGGIRDLTADLSEKQLWLKPVEPGNSVGHLLLHLTGNLNHFVGAQLGGTGYVRDREREFKETNPPAKEEVLSELEQAVELFRRVVSGLPIERLTANHPEERLGDNVNALIHLTAHFALHRGQISYLVRLVKQQG